MPGNERPRLVDPTLLGIQPRLIEARTRPAQGGHQRKAQGARNEAGYQLCVIEATSPDVTVPCGDPSQHIDRKPHPPDPLYQRTAELGCSLTTTAYFEREDKRAGTRVVIPCRDHPLYVFHPRRAQSGGNGRPAVGTQDSAHESAAHASAASEMFRERLDRHLTEVTHGV